VGERHGVISVSSRPGATSIANNLQYSIANPKPSFIQTEAIEKSWFFRWHSELQCGNFQDLDLGSHSGCSLKRGGSPDLSAICLDWIVGDSG
jgi:hypothetical protein